MSKLSTDEDATIKMNTALQTTEHHNKNMDPIGDASYLVAEEGGQSQVELHGLTTGSGVRRPRGFHCTMDRSTIVYCIIVAIVGFFVAGGALTIVVLSAVYGHKD